MTDTARKVVAYVVIGFLLFYLVTQPVAFAAVVRSLGTTLKDGGEALVEALHSFFKALAP